MHALIFRCFCRAYVLSTATASSTLNASSCFTICQAPARTTAWRKLLPPRHCIDPGTMSPAFAESLLLASRMSAPTLPVGLLLQSAGE